MTSKWLARFLQSFPQQGDAQREYLPSAERLHAVVEDALTAHSASELRIIITLLVAAMERDFARQKLAIASACAFCNVVAPPSDAFVMAAMQDKILAALQENSSDLLAILDDTELVDVKSAMVLLALSVVDGELPTAKELLHHAINTVTAARDFGRRKSTGPKHDPN